MNDEFISLSLPASCLFFVKVPLAAEIFIPEAGDSSPTWRLARLWSQLLINTLGIWQTIFTNKTSRYRYLLLIFYFVMCSMKNIKLEQVVVVVSDHNYF